MLLKFNYNLFLVSIIGILTIIPIIPRIVSAWHHNLGYVALVPAAQSYPIVIECSNHPNKFSEIRFGRYPEQEIRQNFDQALLWQPDNPNALIGLGLADCLVSDMKAVELDWIALANHKQVSTPRLQFYLGLAYFLAQEPEKASQAFTTSVGSWAFLQRQAQAASARGDLAQMLRWSELYANVRSTRQSAQLLADIYIRLDRRSEAAHTWQMLIEQTSAEKADFWWAVAEKAKIESDLQSARDAYLRGAELALDQYAFFERLGLAERDAGNWSEALHSFEFAINARPDYEYGYLFAGDMAAKLGQMSKGINYYQQAQKINPSSSHSNIRLALLFMQNQQYEEAIAELNSAIEKKADDAQAYYYLAQSYHSLNRWPEAIVKLELAVELSSQPEWLYLLGTWYEEANMVMEAHNAYQKVLGLLPTHEQARLRIERLEQ